MNTTGATPGKVRHRALTRKPGDQPCKMPTNPVGCDGKQERLKMTTATQNIARTESGLGAILAVALLGLGLLFVAGHAQSAVLHDAAHDVRHATGFPCH